jgi:hypothetical protein
LLGVECGRTSGSRRGYPINPVGELEADIALLSPRRPKSAAAASFPSSMVSGYRSGGDVHHELAKLNRITGPGDAPGCHQVGPTRSFLATIQASASALVLKFGEKSIPPISYPT